MPSIDVAMERSMRRGAMDLLAASLRPFVERRDAVTAVTGVPAQINDWKASFSSWNSCMQANYCKYPVIALIVIGGLIILSVIWCIARCACCGLSCCCECFYCLKCCGNCCGCCDPPGGRKHKYLDDEPYAPPTQGYRSEAPMSAGHLGGGFKPAAHPAAHHEPPQYAEFDVSKKGSDDALPEMPSWESAGNKKVMLDSEPMEMENLKKPENNGQNMPLMTGASPGPASPASPENRSPYGPPPGGAYGSNPYLPPGGGGGGGGGMGDQYGRNSPGYNGNGRGYGPSSSSLAVDQGYGMAGAAGPMGPGRRSPRDYNNGGGGYRMPNQGYPGPQSRQGSSDDYRRNGGGPGMQGYDMGGREPHLPDMAGGGGGGYNEQPPRRSPQPRGDYGYGNGGDRGYGNAPYPPQRNYSSESQRPLAARPPPQRQYSSNTGPASSPSLQNNSGFDFNSGYSRPPTQGRDEYDYGRRPSGGNQGGGGGYPGYKPYQPSDPRQPEGWSGL